MDLRLRKDRYKDMGTNLKSIDKNKVELLADTRNLSLAEIKDIESTYNKLVVELEKEGEKMSKSKLSVAFKLLKIYDNELYKVEYGNMYDFAFDRFGMAKASVSESLNVARRFGSYKEVVIYSENDETQHKYAPQYKLDSAYADFSFTQLYMIRGLLDEEIDDIGITPEMSTRQIKKAIEEYRYGISEDTTKDTDLPDEETEEMEESEVMNPPEKVTLVGKISLDELIDRPLKLEPSKSGYIITLDKDDNIVVKKA